MKNTILLTIIGLLLVSGIKFVQCDEILSEETSETKSDFDKLDDSEIPAVATKIIASKYIAKKIPFKVIYKIYNTGKK